MNFSGKVVIVSGGGKDIVHDVARNFCQNWAPKLRLRIEAYKVAAQLIAVMSSVFSKCGTANLVRTIELSKLTSLTRSNS